METSNNKTNERILSVLLKDLLAVHTATSLAEKLKITRQGLWKSLSKLKKEEIIILEQIGKSKTSTTMITLNWNNPLTEKILSLIITKESLNYQKWRFNFSSLQEEVEFLILFGSILHTPKEANDIDIISVSKENKLGKIKDIVLKIQSSQAKKIHSINFTHEEFTHEIKKQNRTIIEALKKGIVLFGQDNFINFIKNAGKK